MVVVVFLSYHWFLWLAVILWQIFIWVTYDNPAWKRPRGRPQNSWLRQVDASCWELLDTGRESTRRLVRHDRQEWRHRVGEASYNHNYAWNFKQHASLSLQQWVIPLRYLLDTYAPWYFDVCCSINHPPCPPYPLSHASLIQQLIHLLLQLS